MTLSRDNLVWLRGRAASTKRRSLSDTLDEIVTNARLGGTAAGAVRSVVGTIDIAGDDPDLERADAFVRAEFDASLARPLIVHEPQTPPGKSPHGKKPRRG